MTHCAKGIAFSSLLVGLLFASSVRADAILLTHSGEGFYLSGDIIGSTGSTLYSDSKFASQYNSLTASGGLSYGNNQLGGSASGSSQVSPALIGFTDLHVETSAQTTTSGSNHNVFTSYYYGSFTLSNPAYIYLTFQSSNSSTKSSRDNFGSAQNYVQLYSSSTVFYSSSQSDSTTILLSPGTYYLYESSMVNFTSTGTGGAFSFTASASATVDVRLGSSAPEPSTIWLLALGAAGLSWVGFGRPARGIRSQCPPRAAH